MLKSGARVIVWRFVILGAAVLIALLCAWLEGGG